MTQENKWFVKFRRKYMNSDWDIYEHSGIVFRPEEDMQEAMKNAIIEVLNDETIANDGFITIGVEIERIGTVKRDNGSEETGWDFRYREVI